MNPNFQIYIRNDWPLPFVEPWAIGPTNVAKPPFKWKFILVVNLGTKYAWIYDAKDVIKIGHEVNKYLAKPSNLKKFQTLAKQSERQNRKIASLILSLNLNNRPLKELANLFSKWYEAHKIFTTRFMPIDATDETLETDIQNSLRDNGLNLNPSEIAFLLTPNAASYVQREHADFCRLAKKYHNNSSTASALKAIAQHARKWWWTTMGWGHHRPLNTKILQQKLVKIKSVSVLLKIQKKETDARKMALVKKGLLLKRISPATKNLLNAFEVLAEMHDTRKEIQMKMMTAGFSIAKSMLKTARIPEKFCRFMLVEEYLKLGSGRKPELKELENRTKFYWCEFRANSSIRLLSGKQAKNKIKSSGVFYKQSKKPLTEIKGQPASPGYAKGKARVGLNAHTLIRTIKPGEILITSQTTPEFAPAMKKAAAIITDEGGITSHAAIVSRELGIPCIIGTKIATHIFKNGDLVEVNADTGIVKKLKLT